MFCNLNPLYISHLFVYVAGIHMGFLDVYSRNRINACRFARDAHMDSCRYILNVEIIYER